MDKLLKEITKKLFLISNNLLKDYFGISQYPLEVEKELFKYPNNSFGPKGWSIKGGNINLFYKKMTVLPKFALIKTSLNIYGNLITSLEDRLPKNQIKGDFNCSYNALKSLKGCPNKVFDSFDCKGNELKTLKGGPKEVFGFYNCSENELVSLEGAPKKINSIFVCEDNNLRTLKGSLEWVEEDLFCFNNPLTKYFIPGYLSVGGEIHSNISLTQFSEEEWEEQPF